MAKKIYRLHEGGITEETGWFKSGIITSDHLKTIKTEGKDAATSIPTPFATIDLVKSAFKWVSENGIKGNSANHKLVSDALDVAQLFYASPKFKSKIRIVAWNPKDRLKELIENGNKTHRKYAETLQLFWNQDSVEESEIGNEVLYNFEKTNRLYFILNKETNNIIGGTSPATMFFASPDVRKVTSNLEIRIGQDKLFDNEYASLPERETSFIEYIYTLSKQPNFAHNFPEVYEYLEKIRLNILSGELNQRITNLEPENLNEYAPCSVLENENDICEILGVKLGVQQVDMGSISSESDFVIKSDFAYNGIKPLVLPQYPFSKKWTYTTKGIIWDEKTQTPYKNSDSPDKSKLPVQHDPYYWLTVGNFFEDKIIELPYPIDDSKFKTCGSKKHLLPLSATFFRYFKAEKVSQLLTIKERSGGNVDVELKIPVKGGEITFKKQYSTVDKNIETLDVHMAIFPFLKSKEFEIIHNIGLLDDRLDKSVELTMSCFKNGEQLQILTPITRNPGTGGELISKYYKVNNQPNAFGISSNSTNGFVVPIMNYVSGSTKVNFAIDFGTTNTHIEYQYGDNDSIPLDNTPNFPLWQSLINRNTNGIDPLYYENENTFEQEILPFAFSNNNGLHFPLRSALVHNKDIDFKNKVDIVRQVNNYLLLEKRSVPKYLDLNTQLKWSNYADTIDEKKVESYLEFLTTIAFYKTLQLGGNPSNSTITWFYPVSMDEGELGVFFKLWKDVYKRVFNQTSDKGIKGIPESIAPYLYYKSSVEGLSLSIDVGGGSSDIAVFDEDDKNAKLISSFKFAGNAIFGDGYPSNEYQNNSDRNGFVKTFQNAGMDAVKNDEQKESILKNILNERKNSADFSSYLFALEQEESSNFSYTRLLEKNKKMKLSMLVFYGAIAYYSANLLKKAGIGIPKYILLSGTASKSASIVDTSEKLSNLSNMFQFIFESVYQTKAEESLRIKLSSIPKEVTCKGALKANVDDSIKESPIKFWIGGTQDNSWGVVLDREKDVQNTPKYGDLDDKQKSEIEESIKGYYSILDEYIQTIRIESKYIIEPGAYKTFKDLRDAGIKDFLMRGIKAYYKKNDTKIEESLFFYPLIGILNKLSYALAEKPIENE
ncbi:MAG: hypothetical protein JXR48_10175 [Candidatus Delongbacteria bacterium]|nr:hypothetical protein [Candidatus Delongbacteria bacterium]MBN2835321.1 hypothetical protein [Candidatus Delongbacteria bacterium]